MGEYLGLGLRDGEVGGSGAFIADRGGVDGIAVTLVLVDSGIVGSWVSRMSGVEFNSGCGAIVVERMREGASGD